jgi:hypothetical protein
MIIVVKYFKFLEHNQQISEKISMKFDEMKNVSIDLNFSDLHLNLTIYDLQI